MNYHVVGDHLAQVWLSLASSSSSNQAYSPLHNRFNQLGSFLASTAE